MRLSHGHVYRHRGLHCHDGPFGRPTSTEMVRAHDAIVRRALKDALGREVKHTGDGIMATFDEADRAVSCSRSIQSGIDAFNMASAEKLNLRIGMDAGEPWPKMTIFSARRCNWPPA